LRNFVIVSTNVVQFSANEKGDFYSFYRNNAVAMYCENDSWSTASQSIDFLTFPILQTFNFPETFMKQNLKPKRLCTSGVFNTSVAI